MAIDQTDITECYRRIHRPLHNVLMRLLWDGPECQDIAHDAFVLVWNRAGTVDRAALDSLVYATALNLAKNRLRWLGLRRLVGMEHADAAQTDDASQMDSPALRQALSRLPQGQRIVLLLSDIAGFSTAEIAGMLAIPAGTVSSRRHTALRRLRIFLDDSDG